MILKHYLRNWSLLLYFILSFVILNTRGKRIQTFSLYSINDGVSENYTRNIDDLTSTSPIVSKNTLQSVCAQTGVWAFFTGKNFDPINSYGFHPATRGWTCQKRRIMADFSSPFRSIRHLGNMDLDISSLSLFTGSFFSCEELFINGNELSFGSPQEFKSFGFSGTESWTLYSEPDFNGESVCLLCKCDREGRDVGVTYTAKLSVVVGSVRRGCYGRQVLLPTGKVENRTDENITESSEANPMTSPSLSLVSSDRGRSISLSGSEIKIPFLSTFTSFEVDGKSNWTLWTNEDFSGTPTYISYSGDNKSDGTKFPNGSTKIGSLKQGFWTDYDNEISDESIKNNIIVPRVNNTVYKFRLDASFKAYDSSKASSDDSKTTVFNLIETTTEVVDDIYRPTTIINSEFNINQTEAKIKITDENIRGKENNYDVLNNGSIPTTIDQAKEYSLIKNTNVTNSRLDKSLNFNNQFTNDLNNSLNNKTYNISNLNKEKVVTPKFPVYVRPKSNLTSNKNPGMTNKINLSTNTDSPTNFALNSTKFNVSTTSTTTEKTELNLNKTSVLENGKNLSINSTREGRGRAFNLTQTDSANKFVTTITKAPSIGDKNKDSIVPLDNSTTQKSIPFENDGVEEVKENVISTSSAPRLNSQNIDNAQNMTKNERGRMSERIKEGRMLEIANEAEEAQVQTAGMFFTGFLITLGFLIGAMLLTIGIFIYLRVTRESTIDVGLPGLR